MVDWYPTLLGLAGASVEQKLPLDGRDAWPAIARGKPSPHDAILLNTVGREGAVRMGDWKLVRNGEANDDGEGQGDGAAEKSRAEKREDRATAADKEELFNIARDVSETSDLSATEPEKVKELRARLDVFTKEAVPPILKPEQDAASSDTASESAAPKSKNRKKSKP
jgi:arylsulfatase A-like enzyme